MSQRPILIRPTLMFIGAILTFTIQISRSFADELALPSPTTQTKPTASSVETRQSTGAPRKKLAVRHAKYLSKPIGPDVLERTPHDSDTAETHPQQRSTLIPTVWNNPHRLIPTEIDAEYLQINQIQQTGAAISQQPKGANSLVHGKALMSVRSAHSKAKVAKQRVIQDQLDGPGYDTKYFPIVPVNSGLGISTFAPKSIGSTKTTPPVVPYNDPELIRAEIIKSLRTKPFQNEVKPPPLKQPKSTSVVESKVLPQSKPASKPVQKQKLAPKDKAIEKDDPVPQDKDKEHQDKAAKPPVPIAE